MTEHIVQDGEHLAQIAHDGGFADATPVRELNPFVAERLEGHVLAPGDVIVIPDHETKSTSVAAPGHHYFVLSGTPLVLRLRFERGPSLPYSNEACRLGSTGAEQPRTTDAQGLAEVPIPVDAREASATLELEPTPFLPQLVLAVGGLDPVHTAVGQRGRFGNLGYLTHEDGDDERAAPCEATVEEFQRDHGLQVDGDCGPQTQAALVRAHGS